MKSLDNENELLVRIANGDVNAFTTVFRFYERYVYTYGKKLTRSEGEAIEIVQDIFLKIWLNRKMLCDIDNFGGYLNRMVKNHGLNVLRNKALHARAIKLFQISANEIDDSTNLQLKYNETNKLLNEALNSLPPQQRLVYKLCQIEGLKYVTVAERLDISPRTVQVHMSAALKAVRFYIQKNANLCITYLVLLCKMYY